MSEERLRKLPMYDALAHFYDAFTEDIDYAVRADYFTKLIETYGTGKGILLDLACGTGSLSFEMEQRGFDVIGTDISEEMLDEAIAKKTENGSNVMFLNQDMTELDLFGSITSAVCHLDCVNHLESFEKVKKAFERVSFFMEKDGVFLFDVNTLYKHTQVLGNNAFIMEDESCFLAWQNEVDADANVTVYLDFFTANGDIYERESDEIREYYYSDEQLKEAIENAGFELLAVFDDFSEEAPTEISQRKVFVCKKAEQTQARID